MAKKNRDRTTGLPLPSPVVPLGTICITIPVPNALEYRSALKGVLSELGKSWTWSQTEGEDNQDAFTAAELWRAAIAQAEYQLDCEGGMSCADVANCIENNSAVQAALAAQIEQNDALKQAIAALTGSNMFGDELTTPGFPLTPGQMGARLNEIDECAFDPFWAQVEQFVDYLLDLGQDTLEQLAFYAAAVNSGASGVKMAGLISKLKNGTTAGKVTQFLEWVTGTMKGAYEASDNAANRDAIKCKIFCLNRDSCLITLDGTWAALNERVGGLLNPSSITTLEGLADAMLTVSFNPALALDFWLIFLIGSAKTAGILGLEGIDETIQLILKVAVNDANNDWETKCEDCPPPEDCVDWTTGLHGWTVLSGNSAAYGTQISGVGLKSGTSQVAFNGTISAPGMTQFIVEFNGPVTGSLNVRNSNGTGGAVHTLTLANTSTGFFTINKSPGVMTDEIYIGYIPTAPSGTASTYRVRGMCWS